MPDNEKDKEIEDLDTSETPDDVKDEPEVKSEDAKADDFISPGVSGPGEGVLDKIASIFKRDKSESKEIKETEDDVEDKESEEGEEAEAEKKDYEEIDPKFVEAASSYGWDNQRIVDYADGHTDEDLVLMAGLMRDNAPKVKSGVSTDKDIKDRETDEDTEALLKLAEEKPEIAAFIDKYFKPLAKRLDDVSSVSDEVKKDLDSRKEAEQFKEEVRNLETADSILDKSGISSLGKAKDLPTYPDGSYVINDPLFQERSKVWDVAQMFYAKGGTFQQATKNALQWYKGENLEKDVKDKVVKDLKKQEERVMPKRQEASGVKTYTNEEERKADIINAALSKYNIELPS